MRIMRAVYKKECEAFDYGGGKSQMYMGEDFWSIGDTFNGEYIKGTVTNLVMGNGVGIMVEVDGELAMWIAPHDVCRLYYGK